MAVNKKLRFEVFKRDSFTCQYCGRSAPDVVLQCDHIEPVSKGGSDDILNLVTSCFDCNSGKRARTLDDDTVIAKRKAQLDNLQERREQIEMMVEWHKGLIDLKDEQAEGLAQVWHHLIDAYHLTEYGTNNLRDWARRFDFSLLCRAMEAAVNQYVKRDGQDSTPTAESVSYAFRMIPRIAAVMKQEDAGEAIYLKDCLYIRGIVRNRLDRCNEREAMVLLTTAVSRGVDVSLLKQWALEARRYAEWRDGMKHMAG